LPGLQFCGLHVCGLQGFTTGWQLLGPHGPPFGLHFDGLHVVPWQPAAEFKATAPRITGGV
jgi:hypothetical protein